MHHEHQRAPHLPLQRAPHCSAEIWAISQPGSLQIKHIYGVVDRFQVYRLVHSHLSSPSIPTGSVKLPMGRGKPTYGTSSPVAAPHCSTVIWPILQPGSLQIQHFYGAVTSFRSIDPFTHICPPLPNQWAVEHYELSVRNCRTFLPLSSFLYSP